MPTLNDFGDAAYARAEQAIRDFAGRLGIQPEVITQYVNATAHLPQNLDELRAWGRTPNPNYPAFTPMNPDGTWNVLRPGDTPGTMGAKDPGFRHVITNEVDKLQRFLTVNPDGTLFAGSWDPAYNAAHPELQRFANAYDQMAAGATAPAGGATQTAQGGMTRSTQGFDSNNYVGPSPVGFVSVVNGVPNQYATQPEAENDYNQRTGGGGSSGAPPSSSSPAPTGGAPSVGGGGGGGFGGNSGINPGLLGPAIDLANNAAQQAYNQKRLELDRDIANMQNDRQKDQIALQAARDAWQKTYQTATLTGTLNGNPTLDATKQQSDITGYVPGSGYATRAQAAFMNLPADQRTGAAAARIWQSIVPGLTADEAAQMNEAGHQYAASTGGQPMPDDVAAQYLSRITGGRISGQGTPNFQNQQEQDRTLTSVLGLLANLRGPENAFAYANTLASIPDSIKGQIQAAMGRTGVQAQTPAQAGVLGDLGVPGAVSGQYGGTGPGTAVGARAPGPTQFGGNAAVYQGPQPGAFAPLPGAAGSGGPLQPPGAFIPPARVVPDPGYTSVPEDPNARMGLASTAPGAAPASGTTGFENWAQGYAASSRAAGVPEDQIQAAIARERARAAQGPTQRIQPALFSTMPVQSQPMGANQMNVFDRPGALPPGVGPRTGAPMQTGAIAATGQPTVQGGPYLIQQHPTAPGTTAPGMVAANQISPTDYNNTGSYGRSLLWAGYENQGQDKQEAMDQYMRSLPAQSSAPRVGRYRGA